MFLDETAFSGNVLLVVGILLKSSTLESSAVDLFGKWYAFSIVPLLSERDTYGHTFAKISTDGQLFLVLFVQMGLPADLTCYTGMLESRNESD